MRLEVWIVVVLRKRRLFWPSQRLFLATNARQWESRGDCCDYYGSIEECVSSKRVVSHWDSVNWRVQFFNWPAHVMIWGWGSARNIFRTMVDLGYERTHCCGKMNRSQQGGSRIGKLFGIIETEEQETEGRKGFREGKGEMSLRGNEGWFLQIPTERLWEPNNNTNNQDKTNDP